MMSSCSSKTDISLGNMSMYCWKMKGWFTAPYVINNDVNELQNPRPIEQKIFPCHQILNFLFIHWDSLVLFIGMSVFLQSFVVNYLQFSVLVPVLISSILIEFLIKHTMVYIL